MEREYRVVSNRAVSDRMDMTLEQAKDWRATWMQLGAKGVKIEFRELGDWTTYEAAVRQARRQAKGIDTMTDPTAEIRERLEKITPGEWHSAGSYVRDEHDLDICSIETTRCWEPRCGDVPREEILALSNFIAHAPTDIRTLLAEVGRLKAENERLRSTSR